MTPKGKEVETSTQAPEPLVLNRVLQSQGMPQDVRFSSAAGPTGKLTKNASPEVDVEGMVGRAFAMDIVEEE